MPKFVIERQYLVPMYQHIVVEAENLKTACEMAVSEDIDCLSCDLFGRDLQDLRSLRPRPGCRDRLPSSWRLASGREDYRGPRRPRRRALDIP